MKLLAPILLAIVGAILGTPASAHHGFTGRYDTDRPVWLTGTVVHLQTQPPHPTMVLKLDATQVPAPGSGLPVEFTSAPVWPVDQAGRDVTVEFAPVGAFFSLSQQVKPGDRVEILALRNCRSPHQIRSQWLRLPSGAVVQREGRLSYMAKGCAD